MTRHGEPIPISTQEWAHLQQRIIDLESQLTAAKEEIEKTKQWIATTAENHIDLCRELGTHTPIRNSGCFGVAECVNCFRIGFLVARVEEARG